MLVSQYDLNVTLWLTSDNQLDGGGRTHVAQLEPFWGQSPKMPSQQVFESRQNTTTDYPTATWARQKIDGNFHRFLCVLASQKHVRNRIIHGFPWITVFFGYSWGNPPIIFTRDCLIRDNSWRITLLVTKKIAIHGNPYIVLYHIFIA